MTVQEEHHKCEEMPTSLDIMRFRIDNKDTEWAVYFAMAAREGCLRGDFYIKYCPFCGERLGD